MTRRRRGWVAVFPLTAAIALMPGHAKACEPLAFDVEFLLPRPAEAALEGVLFALVDAPSSSLQDEVSLTTSEGLDLPVEVMVERDGANEHALVRARPLEPLAAQTEYVWTIGDQQLAFTTGDASDLQAPSVGEIVTTYAGNVAVDGCIGGSDSIAEYDVAVTGLDEPVVIFLEDQYTRYYAAWDMPARVSGTDACFDVYVEDPGGHTVAVGSTCLGDDGGTDTSDETTGDASSTDETGSDAQLEADKLGCSCRARPPAPTDAAPLILLAGLAAVRRRRQ